MCAGYGGIGLGLKNIFGERLRTIAYCELEGFAQANLISKMEKGLLDAAPIWSDLKTFPYKSFHGLVDILIAGYPCQPFSAAGKRAGKEDPRHLWPWIADGIRLLQPKMCFFENVEGHISLGLREVIGELESIGYKAAWGIFSAAEVGAPHQRKRVFILAYDKSQRIQGHWADWLQEPRPHAGQGLPLRGGDAGCGELADALCNGGREGGPIRQGTDGAEPVGHGQSRGVIELADACHGSNPAHGYAEAHRLPSEHWQEVCSGVAGGANATAWPSRPGQPQHGWEPPRVVGNAIGIHEYKCIGRKSEQLESWDASEAMGHADSTRPQERQGQRGTGIQGIDSDGGEYADGQAQPTLGRDADGSSGGLGYAELQVSCDNRTDELRLLGNGVVPATAERAFLTLLEKLK